jgi:hypothetical protein
LYRLDGTADGDVARLYKPLRDLAVQDQAAEDALFTRRRLDGAMQPQPTLLTSDLHRANHDNQHLEQEIGDLLERLQEARHKVAAEAADFGSEEEEAEADAFDAGSAQQPDSDTSSMVERLEHGSQERGQDYSDDADISGHDLLSQVRALRQRLTEPRNWNYIGPFPEQELFTPNEKSKKEAKEMTVAQ